MKFSIREGNPINYDDVKQDYINGLVGNKLMAKYGIGSSQYTSLLKRFREDGIPINKQGEISPVKEPKYYHKMVSKCNMYFVVKRTIEGVLYYGGVYKTEIEAKQRVNELNNIGWESCL